MKLKKTVLFAIALLMLVFVSCSKNTDPARFDKIIQEGKWRIGRAYFQNTNTTSLYTNKLFTFTEPGGLKVTSPTDTIAGSWSRGSDKDPLIFYMNFSTVYTDMIPLADDWIVMSLTKEEIKLLRNNGSDDEIILRKKG